MLRRGRPILRTAALVGTASAVSGGVQHRQQQKWAAQEQRQAAPPPPQNAPEPAGPDITEELTKLAELHTQGILTDEEFAAKKAQILGI